MSKAASSANRPDKLKICFLSLYSYPLFNPACISPFGGTEVRISLIARELAKYPDLDVNVVLFDHGQPRREVRDGVTLHAWPRRYCPIRADNPWAGAPPKEFSTPGVMAGSTRIAPGQAPMRIRARLYFKAHSPRGMVELLRRLRYPIAFMESQAHRASAFFRGESLFGSIRSHAIRESDVRLYDEIAADIYVAHGVHDLAGCLAYYCRRRSKKFVMISGSDQDFIAARNAQTGLTDIYGSLGFLMGYTIENADLILVQTKSQAELAASHFGRKAIVILNPIDTATRFPRAVNPRTILWVGKSDDLVKRPELFLNLARSRPEFEFVMIMSLAIDNVHRRILAQCRDLPNLRVIPYVPHEEIEKYFAEAGLLVNTSAFEGFPDAFLQAAKYGVPIVSLHADPNGMLSEYGCGAVADGDCSRLAEQVSLFMTDSRRHNQAGGKGRAYVAAHHDKQVLIPHYFEAMTDMTANGEGKLRQAR